MILIVGATGQLGTAVACMLAATDQPVRALVRRTSSYQHLRDPNIELAFGDLRDADSIDAACGGVETVLATANAILPRTGDSFEAIEGKGYENLFRACQRHEVKQFVFVSAPVTPVDGKVPAFRFKRLNEKRLQHSDIPYTIVRPGPFMDDWLALLGSSIPLRDAVAPTLRRPFWFSQMYMRGVGQMVEGRGIALIPGSGKTRHAFISLDDVVAFLVGCIGHPQGQNAVFHVDGPEVLSLDEVVAIFARVLGRPVRAVHTPAAVFRILQLLLSPLSAGAGNIMGMNWYAGMMDTPYCSGDATAILNRPLITVEQFLRQKVNLLDD